MAPPKCIKVSLSELLTAVLFWYEYSMACSKALICGTVAPMLLSYNSSRYTGRLYAHDKSRNLVERRLTSRSRAIVCDRAEKPLYLRRRVRNRHCPLFQNNLAVDHCRECKYFEFIGSHDSHLASDVVARKVPGARAPCIPAAECYGCRHSSLNQLQYDHETCGRTRSSCDDM